MQIKVLARTRLMKSPRLLLIIGSTIVGVAVVLWSFAFVRLKYTKWTPIEATFPVYEPYKASFKVSIDLAGTHSVYLVRDKLPDKDRPSEVLNAKNPPIIVTDFSIQFLDDTGVFFSTNCKSISPAVMSQDIVKYSMAEFETSKQINLTMVVENRTPVRSLADLNPRIQVQLSDVTFKNRLFQYTVVKYCSFVLVCVGLALVAISIYRLKKNYQNLPNP